ncbi:SDR family NAD(P)-dependent oxidoreductase [Desulfitobacterium hafniense]|nr:SDR family oxidoreductase [Desulfitobacterium hafniense]
MRGKIAVVTGGLSGIGKACSLAFAQQQCTVVILDIQDEKAEETIKHCREAGGDAVYRNCNLLEYENIKSAFQFIEGTYGRLDYAINNAGFGFPPKPMDESTYEEVRTLYGINVQAYSMCMIHELRMMKEVGFGRIVNIASGTGLIANKGYSMYSAAKHAVVGMTKAAALDYAKDNITVNAIAPGTIETELVASLKFQAPEAYEQAKAANPSGRFGQPWEIARVALFLCEADSSFINGAIIPVDSGGTAGK